MALELILIDAATKEELGRRPMTSEQERYHLYQACLDHELISLEGKRYKPTRTTTLDAMGLVGVWQIPERNFVMWVTFDSVDPAVCCEDD